MEKKETKSFKASMKALLSGRRGLILICCFATNLSLNYAISQVAPFLPHEAALRNISEFKTGIIFAAFGASIFVFSFVFGSLTPLIGRKRMLVGGLWAESVLTILFALTDYFMDMKTFFATTVIVRILCGVAAAATQVAMLALLTTEFPDDVSTVLGTAEVFSGAGFMVGPPIGAMLFEAGGFRLPFFVTAGLIAAFALILTIAVPKDEGNHEKKKAGNAFALLGNWRVFFTSLGCFMSVMGLTYMDPSLQPFLSSAPLSFSIKEVGLIFFIVAFIYAVMSVAMGHVADHHVGPKPVIIFGEIFTCAAYLLIGPSPLLSFFSSSPSRLFVYISSVVLGVGISAGTVPSIADALHGAEGRREDLVRMKRLAKEGKKPHKHVDQERVEEVSGVINAMYSLGGVLGPLGGTFLQENVFSGSFPWTATVVGLMIGGHGIINLFVTVFFPVPILPPEEFSPLSSIVDEEIATADEEIKPLLSLQE